MLLIDGAQLARFRQDLHRARIHREICEQIGRFTPHAAAALGPQGVLRCVIFAETRARAHQITDPECLRFYTELMFMYGGFFDTDPLLPWARDVFVDSRLTDEQIRVACLYDAAIRYLNVIGGPRREYATRALQRIQEMWSSEFGSIFDEKSEEAELFSTLRRVYPQRIDYLGEAPIRQLFRAGIDEANRLRLATPHGRRLVMGLMFALGHGFAEDPTLSWISAVLVSSDAADPSIRVRLLENRVRLYLRVVLARLQ